MKNTNINSKYFFISVALIILMSMALPFAGACIDAQIVSSSYLPRETFQAEITGNFTRSIDSSNIAFYKGSSKVDVPFSIEQLASNKFFVYADMPLFSGQYVFSVKNALCIENGILKEKTIEKNFEIKKPVYLAFSWLSDSVKAEWPDNAEDNALAAAALSFDSALFENGTKTLLDKKNTAGYCWPEDEECRIKTTALVGLALHSSEVKEWLLSAQNSVSKGLWNLLVESNSNIECTFQLGNIQKVFNVSGNKSMNFNFPDDSTINTVLTCSNSGAVLSARITNTLLGTVTEYPLIKQTDSDSFKKSFNNKNCWGQTYNNKYECEGEATAYALWALYDFDKSTDSKAIEWLKNDAENSQSTIEKAFVYLFTKDTEIKNWLLNNQAKEGYFTSKSLILSQQPDMIATIITTFILEESGDAELESATTKSKNWLKEQYNQKGNFGTLFETALALYKIFPSDIEPILSISPAVIKTRAENNFTITLKNYGMLGMDITASMNGEEKKINLAKGSIKTITFTAPRSSDSRVTFGELKIEYSNFMPGKDTEIRSYKVPVIIFPKKSEIEKMINETVIQEKELITPSLKFVETSVNQNIEADKKTVIGLKLKNPSQGILYNISIEYDYSLQGLLEEINPLTISQLNPGEEKIINITVNTEQSVGGLYSGTITAKSWSISASIPFAVTVIEKAKEKTCSEIDGTICADDEKCDLATIVTSDGECCAGEGKCQKQLPEETKAGIKKTVGILLISIAVLAVIIFLYFKLKPKKETMPNVLEKIEKKYEQRY